VIVATITNKDENLEGFIFDDRQIFDEKEIFK